MPSPFPGMDPYLEAHWRDVHARLVVYIRDALQENLPAGLRARVEERVVLENGERTAADGASAGEPMIVEAEREPLTEGYLEIVDVGSGSKVVTVEEVFSPTNKVPGEGLEQYRRKQRELCRSDTSLVEIDLLRLGKHTLAVPLENIAPRRRTPYMACVRRAWVRGKAEVYPMPLDQRLPAIKVPLRPTDPDAVLDLQALIEQCYVRGRYEGTLNYGVDADPPLTSPDADWADGLLRERGLRPAQRRKGKG
jgi:hypothetical protein